MIRSRLKDLKAYPGGNNWQARCPVDRFSRALDNHREQGRNMPFRFGGLRKEPRERTKLPLQQEPGNDVAGRQPDAAGLTSASTQVHLHRDTDEIGMIFRAKLLLEQRSGVGNCFVGDAECIGYFGNLVASPEQRQNLQLTRRHLVCWTGFDSRGRKGDGLRKVR